MSTVTGSDAQAFLVEVSGRMDVLLGELLPDPASGELAAAMGHIVHAGGKRLRPALVELGCLDVGGRVEQAQAPAAAVELIHAYSLVHDDLPCMDDARLRRGRPCVHVVWGEAVGVLAGDALLTLAFEVLARRAAPGAPVAALVAVLAEAAGWAGMVGGQVLDLRAQGRHPDVSEVRAIHLGKTAALLEASLRLGALAGGGRAVDVERLGRAGRELGLAFQIVDDLLDVTGSTADLGKAAGADAQVGKVTWPAAVGVDQARADAEAASARALELCRGGREAGRLAALAELLLRRSR